MKQRDHLVESGAVHHETDVDIGRALRDHVDTVVAQRSERLLENACHIVQILADYTHLGLVAVHINIGERRKLADDIVHILGRIHRDGNVGLRRAYQIHRHIVPAEDLKHAHKEAGNIDHLRREDVDYQYVLLAGNGFYTVIDKRILKNYRSLAVRIYGIQHFCESGYGA